MPEHALLSASGAARWLACPPSAKLEAQEPDTTSGAAAEGTEAHALADLMIRYDSHDLKKTEYNKLKKRFTEGAQYYGPAMEDYISDFAHRIWSKAQDLKERYKEDPLIMTEQRVDFSEYVRDGFGTSDVIMICGPELIVVDLKYGTGVPVSAADNPQIRLYALGALSEYSMIYDINTVTMIIDQVRLAEGYSEDTLTPEELTEWGNAVVRPKAELAAKGEGEQTPGPHCQFCRARKKCAARARQATKEFASSGFPEGKMYLDEIQLANIVAHGDEWLRWIKDVQDYALKSALAGLEIPGFKLVGGRSNRQYTDKEAVLKTLSEHTDYTAEELTRTELLGITALEALLGKNRFAELVGNYVEKPQGKPVLVPITDNRPALNSAEKDYENMEETENE